MMDSVIDLEGSCTYFKNEQSVFTHIFGLLTATNVEA